MDRPINEDPRTGAHASYPADPAGARIYWHESLAECRDPDCPQYHITRAELWPWGDDDDRARDFDRGVSAGKGEL